MEHSDSLKQQNQITKTIWLALLLSNFVFCYIVASGYVSSEFSDLDSVWGLIACFCIGMFALSLTFYKKMASPNKLKKLRLEVMQAPAPKITPNKATQAQYEKLSDEDKKRFNYNAQVLTRMIACWGTAESVNIMAMVGVNLGMPTTYYYSFFVATIGLMIYLRPTTLEGRG